jgi:hypothetical protein
MNSPRRALGGLQLLALLVALMLLQSCSSDPDVDHRSSRHQRPPLPLAAAKKALKSPPPMKPPPIRPPPSSPRPPSPLPPGRPLPSLPAGRRRLQPPGHLPLPSIMSPGSCAGRTSSSPAQPQGSSTAASTPPAGTSTSATAQTTASQAGGNNELQCYTNSPDNLRVEASGGTNGHLVMQANVNSNPGSACVNIKSPNSTRAFTSAKVTSAGEQTRPPCYQP